MEIWTEATEVLSRRSILRSAYMIDSAFLNEKTKLWEKITTLQNCGERAERVQERKEKGFTTSTGTDRKES